MLSYIPDYHAPLTIPSLNSSQNLNTLEPDQIEGIPTSATEVKKKDVTTELGGTGTAIVSGFLTGQDYNQDFTGTKPIDIFDEMRLSDATVRAGLNMVKLRILSADWYIKEPSGNTELGEPAAFAHRQLFKNPNFSGTAFLRQALTMCDNGNAIFKKEFEVLSVGKIGRKRFVQTLKTKLVSNKQDDYGSTNPSEVNGVRRLEAFAETIDLSSAEYEQYTLIGILSKNFTLGQIGTN